MKQKHLVVRGAREHNLKNINVTIPRNQLVVVTGLSGSGKSSLAFDTIYAEGHRRYVESLSAYARQFLGQMEKPDVDRIEGLSPAISIEQKTTGRNPRSTVGTMTEIYDYLRLLFARAGTPHCPTCGRVIAQQSIQQMQERILGYPAGTRVAILAPLVRGRKGEHRKVFETIESQGYVRARVDGEMYEIENVPRAPQAEEARHRRGHRSSGGGCQEHASHRGFAGSGREAFGRNRERGRRRRGARVLAAVRVRPLRHELRRIVAAHVLVQLALRRLHRVRRTGLAHGFQRGARRPRRRSLARRRCARTDGEAQGRLGTLAARCLGQPRGLPTEHAVVETGPARARRDPPRHRRRNLREDGLRQSGGRVPHHLRGPDSMAASPLQEHVVGEHSQVGRNLHDGRAVRGVRRLAFEAGSTRGARGTAHHRRCGAHECRARIVRNERAQAGRERGDNRCADPARDRGAHALPVRRGPGLSLAGSQLGHPRRRRSAAPSPRDPNRVQADGRPLYPRRAVDRAPPPRQRTPDQDAQRPARHRQQRARHRARPRHHPGGGLRDRLGAGCGHPRWRSGRGGDAGGNQARPREPHRQVSARRTPAHHARRPRAFDQGRDRGQGCAREQSQEHRRRVSAGRVHRRHGGERLRQEHVGE